MEAICTGLLSKHFVIANPGLLLTTDTDAPLPSFLNCLSPGSWHNFGTQFFIMVPVAGRPFANNASIRSIVVKHQSKNRWLPVGTDSTMHRTAAAPKPNLWPLNIFFPWYNSKSSIRQFGEVRTRPLGQQGLACLDYTTWPDSSQWKGWFAHRYRPSQTSVGRNSLVSRRQVMGWLFKECPPSLFPLLIQVINNLDKASQLEEPIPYHFAAYNWHFFFFWHKTFWIWDSQGSPCGLICQRRS